ncbi:undecaprenyl-diphosphatase UppP [Elusimicrobiota bacterium]
MEYHQSIILGIVQGLTEFLPISSSAHLVLMPYLVHWQYQGLAFDVALHLGTLSAIVAYFWKDWIKLVSAGFSKTPSINRSLFWWIVLATLPGAVAGLLLEDYAETVFRDPRVIALTLITFGIVLGVADRFSKRAKKIEDLDWKLCLLVGIAQALAIVPGVSRAGITITAGLLLGLKRDEAARFSFLLATPIIAGAGVLALKDLDFSQMGLGFPVGVLAAALSGLASIWFLLNYLKKRNLGVFVFYRVCIGLLILFLIAMRAGTNLSKLKEVPAPQEMVKAENIMSLLAKNLSGHVNVLAGDIGERNFIYPEKLIAARDYIKGQFESIGYSPRLLEYKGIGIPLHKDGFPFYNIEAIAGAHSDNDSGMLVIGAHYDSAPDTPGADDNASAVAVLIELSRMLKTNKQGKEVRLVAFSTEEPPFFGTSNMGSYQYANMIKAQNSKVEGMISLEMVGYYNDNPKSQFYPPLLSFFYPSKGNFIALVGNLSSRGFLSKCKKAWKKLSDFPLETASLPMVFESVKLSDHMNFWEAGFPALMLTDTAYFRNPNYHGPADTADKLDYEKMAGVTQALAGIISNWQ